VTRFPGLVTLRCMRALASTAAGRIAEAAREIETLAADSFAALPRDSLYLASMAILSETAVTCRAVDLARPIVDELFPYASRNLIQGVPVGWGAAAWYIARLQWLLGQRGDAARSAATAQRLHRQWGAGGLGHPLADLGRQAPAAPLSQRELEVLTLLACGQGNSEIAAALGVSVHTPSNATWPTSSPSSPSPTGPRRPRGPTAAGWSADYLAIRHPDRLLGLVLADPLGAVPDGGAGDLERILAARIPSGRAARARELDERGHGRPRHRRRRPGKPGHGLARILLQAGPGSPDAAVEHFRGLLRRYVRFDLVALRAPDAGAAAARAAGAGHLGAGRGQPIPPGHGMATAALIPGAQYRIEPDCGYFAWLEHPGSVRQAVPSICR
jgi:hypothetical protein